MAELHPASIVSFAVIVAFAETEKIQKCYPSKDFFGLLFSRSCLCSTGLQAILPGYLQSRFIQAALNYIGCKSEGQFVCQNGDCWCECSADFPQCNCPHSDLDTLENNLLRFRDAWSLTNQEFEESGESGILIHCDL